MEFYFANNKVVSQKKYESGVKKESSSIRKYRLKRLKEERNNNFSVGIYPITSPDDLKELMEKFVSGDNPALQPLDELVLENTAEESVVEPIIEELPDFVSMIAPNGNYFKVSFSKNDGISNPHISIFFLCCFNGLV